MRVQAVLVAAVLSILVQNSVAEECSPNTDYMDGARVCTCGDDRTPPVCLAEALSIVFARYALWRKEFFSLPDLPSDRSLILTNGQRYKDMKTCTIHSYNAETRSGSTWTYVCNVNDILDRLSMTA